MSNPTSPVQTGSPSAAAGAEGSPGQQLRREETNLVNSASSSQSRSPAGTSQANSPQGSTSSGNGLQVSASASPSNNSISGQPSPQDEELKRATEMASAISNNPHMSMDEIHKLLAEKRVEEQQQILADTNSSNAANATTKSKKGKGAFRFDGSRLMAARAFISNHNHHHNDGSSTNIDNALPETAANDAPEKEKKLRFPDGSRFKSALQKSTSVKDDLLVSGTGSGDTTPKGRPKMLQLRSKVVVRTPPPSPPKSRKTANMYEGGSNLTPSLQMPPSDFTSSSNTPTNKNDNLLPTPSNIANQVATPATAAASTLYQTLTTGIAAATGALPMLPATNPTDASSSVPIRLTGIAWKRRGGMGKFSASGAWERRRIELQGTKLYYYANDLDEVDPDSGLTSPKNSNTTPTNSGLSRVGSNDDATDGVVVAKQASWFESTFTAATMEDANAPRGFLDLCREKAHVHAAFGHSGAPSPFAISIKVRGAGNSVSTKWKLCFDYHETQMEWLAALTDVIVQNSVDQYNAQLLYQSDPSHQTDGVSANQALAMVANATGAVAEPNKAPPTQSTDTPAAGMRLWQMSDYQLSSIPLERRIDDDSDVDDVGYESEVLDGTLVKLATEEEHDLVRARAAQQCRRVWTLPSENAYYFALVVNAAIFLSRSSSTSLERFWFVVVFTNALLYSLLIEVPDWKGLLPFVFAQPALLENLAKNDGAAAAGDMASDGVKSKSAAKIEVKPSFVPIAGTSTIRLKNPTDPPVNAKNEIFAGWRNPPGEGSMVRSHGYLSTKKKIPSPGELYEVIQCDIFEAPKRYEDLAPRVKLPEVVFEDDDGLKTWRSPDLFVITVSLPTDPPRLTGSAGEGGGYCIIMYCKMKKETREILRRVTADGYDHTKEDHGPDIQKSKVNAVRLLEEWVRRAPTDQSWFSRFKCVPNAHNLKEIGMPSWISKYNGKPFLIKRPGVTGFIHQHPELSVFEFDLSLHAFPYLARQGICFLKENFFKKVLVSFAFVIEGRSDDELPECVIGVLQLCYPDPAHGIQAVDFFSGKSPKSFDSNQ